MGTAVARARILGVLVVVIAAALVVVPRVSAADEVHLAAVGDFGARANTNAVLTKLAQTDPDATLALGDLAYGDSPNEQAWCDFVKAKIGQDKAFQLVSGNHESLDVNDGDINNFSACLPNQVPGIVGTYGRQYYMDFPKGAPTVRVIQVSKELTFEDGKWTYSAGDPRYTWVANAIDDARAQGAKWIVVSTHLPCMSVGSYACPANRDLYNLLVSKKVDLVLHGHEHAYMRTHQLRAGVTGCSTLVVGSVDPDCIADSDSDFAAGQGTVFATVGTGGTPVRDVNSSDSEAGYFAAFTGLNRDPSYGFLDLAITDGELKAKFVAAVGTGADAFTITKQAQAPNQSPTADFNATTSGASVTVDGTASGDPDGSIASYDWQFGDGQTATGPTPPPHAYQQSGTYTVTLTVTDNSGASSSTTKSVTIDPQSPAPVLAEDAFGRTVAAGWGSATTGGAWSVYPSSALSVASGQGRITTPLAGGRNAYLNAVSSDATDFVAGLSIDKVATGGGFFTSLAARAVPNAGEYRAKVKFRNDGRPSLSLVRTNAAGAETTLRSETLASGLTYGANDKLMVRVQVAGTAEATVRARIWRAGDAEPTTWLVSATDTTPALQAPGRIGFITYLSSTATNAPIVLSVDDVLVTRP